MDSAHSGAERSLGPGSRPERGERRTVQIRGQVVPPPRRRSVTAAQLTGRPDRMVMLGIFMLFMAVITATP